MKKIINNKVYDTDTARCVGSWSSSDDPRAFQYVEETLFRKKNGEFFLHGFGGPASVYRVATSENSWRSGEKIILTNNCVDGGWSVDDLLNPSDGGHSTGQWMFDTPIDPSEIVLLNFDGVDVPLQ